MTASPLPEKHYLRGTHKVWTRRLEDGKQIFTVLPNDKEPGEDDGGYYSIDAALTQKGMM
jgi:hypothetical protein